MTGAVVYLGRTSSFIPKMSRADTDEMSEINHFSSPYPQEDMKGRVEIFQREIRSTKLCIHHRKEHNFVPLVTATMNSVLNLDSPKRNSGNRNVTPVSRFKMSTDMFIVTAFYIYSEYFQQQDSVCVT